MGVLSFGSCYPSDWESGPDYRPTTQTTSSANSVLLCLIILLTLSANPRRTPLSVPTMRAMTCPRWLYHSLC